MKLAEALLERKAIKEKIQALRERMLKDARVQEGEKPAEAPAELMAQVAELTVKLERLTVAINRTNVVARLPD
ncbi:MAG: DIP1984 family protein, partial [Firmicutes bacterium]|nr:DIP1984 family protein [Bacillota bacterium]